MKSRTLWSIAVLAAFVAVAAVLSLLVVRVARVLQIYPWGEETCSVYVVRSSDGATLGTVAHSGPVSSAVLSPDGRLLASADGSGRVVLSRATDCKLVRVLSARPGTCYLRFSPDGGTLAVATGTKCEGAVTYTDLGLLRLPDGKRMDILRDVLPPNGLETGLCIPPIAFSPDGKLLMSDQGDGTLKVFRVADGTPVWQLGGLDTSISRVAVSPDSKLIAGQDGTHAIIWTTSDGKRLRALDPKVGQVMQSEFSPDSRLLAVAGDQGIAWYRVQDGALMQRVAGQWPVAFSRDGKLIASKTGQQTVSVSVWRTADGSLLSRFGTLKPYYGSMYSLAFLPKDTLIVEAWDTVSSRHGTYDDYVVRAFSVRGGKAARLYSLEPRVIRDISRDGKLLAISGPPPRH